MSWKINYSAAARQDLRDIFEYIAFRLSEPEIAKKQSERIMQKIRSLDEMPLRHRLYGEEPWHSQGIRFFPVNNYLIFYLPVAEINTVNIVRIIYGGRDIKNQLNETIDF